MRGAAAFLGKQHSLRFKKGFMAKSSVAELEARRRRCAVRFYARAIAGVPLRAVSSERGQPHFANWTTRL